MLETNAKWLVVGPAGPRSAVPPLASDGDMLSVTLCQLFLVFSDTDQQEARCFSPHTMTCVE
jgi:hypothetical protein